MEEILKAQGNARLSELFKIEVVATSHYLIQSERPNFIAEVEKLREQIISHATSNESSSDSVPIPTSTFTTIARKIWLDVKKDKILGLPSSTIMAAKKHCDRIADEQRESFKADTSWIRIKEDVESGSIIPGFGKDVSNLIRTYAARYYRLTEKVDETIREERRERLTKELLEIIKQIYFDLVECLKRETVKNFNRAALGQLMRDGRLEGVEDQAFIDQFNHRARDAYVEQAKWTHASSECDALQNHIDDFRQTIEEINAQLDDQFVNLGQVDRNLFADRRELRRSLWNQFAFQCGHIGIHVMPLVVNAILKSFGLETIPIHRF